MPIKLLRWGNSTGLRLPAPVLMEAGLKPGSLVTVRLLDSGEIRVKPIDACQTVEEGPVAVLKKAVTLEQW